MEEANVIKQITENTERSKSNSYRLNDLEKQMNNLSSLTNAIHDVAAEVKYMRQDMDRLSTKVEAIENKPAERWETVVTTIITVVISAVIGFILRGIF